MAPQPGPPSGYYAVRTCCPLRAAWPDASLLLRAIRILQHSCQRADRGPRASLGVEGARRFPSGSPSWGQCQLLSPLLPATSFVTHVRVSIADEKADAVPRLPRYAFTGKRTTNQLREAQGDRKGLPVPQTGSPTCRSKACSCPASLYCLPDLYRFIVAGRGDTCPIGRPGYCGCPCSVFLMGIETGAASGVPYLDRCIITGGGE